MRLGLLLMRDIYFAQIVFMLVLVILLVGKFHIRRDKRILDWNASDEHTTTHLTIVKFHDCISSGRYVARFNGETRHEFVGLFK